MVYIMSEVRGLLTAIHMELLRVPMCNNICPSVIFIATKLIKRTLSEIESRVVVSVSGSERK